MGAAAQELVDFDEAYAKTDWSRFAHLTAFEAANRRTATTTTSAIKEETTDDRATDLLLAVRGSLAWLGT